MFQHFVQDDLRQGAGATRFLTKECTVDQPGFIDTIVVCELAWVLARFFQDGREDVLAVIRTLLATSMARVQDNQTVEQTLMKTEREGWDFPDQLILLRKRQSGCDATVTFDRRFARLGGTRLLSP